MQLLVFDLVFLLLAVLFATRGIALLVLGIIVSTMAFYLRTPRQEPLAGSLGFAADTLLRDGLFAIGFTFCLGIAAARMVEAADQRSEQALRETRA